MTTKDYIKQFGLDKEGHQFNREEFIQCMGKEFLERVQICQTACLKMGSEFTGSKFQQLAKEQMSKYWAISNKRVGGQLTEELWNFFYATVVIPIRAEYLPEFHKEVTERRERRIQKEKEMAEKLKAKEREKEERKKPLIAEMEA